MDSKELVSLALKARENAYAPYSNFKVGAALLTKDGEVYFGCNIENAAYGLCNCAERTAIFKAVSEGKTEFAAIAIIGSSESDYCSPCGSCRQVMNEFCDAGTFRVIMAKNEEDYIETVLENLLPMGFGPKNMS